MYRHVLLTLDLVLLSVHMEVTEQIFDTTLIPILWSMEKYSPGNNKSSVVYKKHQTYLQQEVVILGSEFSIYLSRLM